jgi:fructokinase
MDLLSIGELVVDRIVVGSSHRRFFGGAPSNVAVNYAQLGGEAGLIAKVGADASGRFLLDKLSSYGVACDGVVVDPRHRTSEIFIASGETPCRPARDADTHLRASEISVALVSKCRILHTSAFSLAQEPSRSAVLEAVRLAKLEGKLVSLEPNYRPWIWPARDEAQVVLEGLLASADVVKPSVEDARSLYGEMAPEEYLHLFRRLGPPLVVLTLGEQGCLVNHDGQTAKVAGYKVELVDSLGAGDAFWAGFLLRWLGGETPVDAARFGNAVAALNVGTVGAIAPLPLADGVYGKVEDRVV